MNTSMKKIIMLAILAMTVFSCSLLDNEAYQEMKRDRAERGVKCYERYDGHVRCEDRDGNRVY